MCIGLPFHTDRLSLFARGSYPNLDVLYGRPCKWTTVSPILVTYKLIWILISILMMYQFNDVFGLLVINMQLVLPKIIIIKKKNK